MNYVRVTTDSTSRSKLTVEQQDFFKQVVTLAQYTQAEIYAHCLDEDFPKFTYFGIAASVLAAHFIIKSDFGSHLLAQPKYFWDEDGERKWQHANNLALLEIEPADEKFWRRPTLPHTDGKVYKSFVTWGEFSINFSDRVTWTHNYEDVLSQKSVRKQVEEMSKKEKKPADYLKKVNDLITTLELMEFDRGF